MVLSVEAKCISSGKWEVFTDNGRERTGRDVIEWVSEAVDLGAGEILLTSIDREGTRTGFDLELLSTVSSSVNVPIIASGGMGSLDHAVSAFGRGISAVAMADILHYQRATISDVRAECRNSGISHVLVHWLV